MTNVFTVGDIVSALGVPHHRVTYQLRRHKPVAYANQVRLFDQQVLDEVRAELERISALRLPRRLTPV